ncbi:MAG TPA: hypothetical protein H9668_05485 [Firmicutes bacterium]|nr:hypothetical protein [Bacillota bacterium]
MNKTQEEKKEARYCRAVSQQVDKALKSRQKAGAADARRRTRLARQQAIRREREEERKARIRQRAAARRAWNIKKGRPLPLEAPVWLTRPAAGRRPDSLRDLLSRKEARAGFLRAFWLTALFIGCPVLALLGMGEAYTAVRANGFAEDVPALALAPSEGGLRLFDFFIQPDALPGPARWFLQALIQLSGPALRLLWQFFTLLPRVVLGLLQL